MDSINVERIHALRRYKQQQYMNTLMFYPIVTVICVVFCTSPFWLPSLYSSTKTFLCQSIPTILSFFFNAKSLFILGNIIVIFLLGESKIQPSNSSSSTSLPPSLLHRKIEAEKVKRKKKKKERRLQDYYQVERKKEEEVKMAYVEVNEEEEHQVEEEIENRSNEEEKREDYIVDNNEQEVLVSELSAEELNRRADNFIARVNQQIRFEANHEVLLCSY